MKIEIHSIKSIEDKSMLAWPPRTSLISIGDPDAPPPKLLHKPDHILRLVFDDITIEEVKEEFKLPGWVGDSVQKLTELLKQHNTFLFDEAMALRTAKFIYDHHDETDLLICQCHYGQSRSAGFAAAISEHFCGNGIEVFANEQYCPNKLVYHKMMVALENQKRVLAEEFAVKLQPTIKDHEEMRENFNKPRDSNRMDGFFNKLKMEWIKEPDWRFGQLMYNFFAESGDPFYWEEDIFIKRLQEYMGPRNKSSGGTE